MKGASSDRRHRQAPSQLQTGHLQSVGVGRRWNRALMKLAAALNRSVAYFVDEEPSEAAILVRSDERKKVFTSKERLDLAGISGPYGQFFMAGAVATVEPEADSGPKPMEHPGEELVFMLDGSLCFTVEGEEYVLRRGDALHFRTDRPHRWWNPSSRPARAVWMALRST